MKLDAAQRKYREANRDTLRVKNRENMRARRADPEKRAALLASQQRTYFRRKYGLELEQVQAMWDEREGRCDLCKVSRPAPHHTGCHAAHKLVVDHCHESNTVRGMLCYQCNTALGQLGDNAVALQRVLEYIGGGG